MSNFARRGAVAGAALVAFALAAADEPEALAKLREAHGGTKNLAAVKSVRLEGLLSAGNVRYRYTETWTDDAFLAVYKLPTEEISKGFDGKTGWSQSGSATARELPEADVTRLKEGLALRKLLLLRFDGDAESVDGGLKCGRTRVDIGKDGLIAALRWDVDKAEAKLGVDMYLKLPDILFPTRWRASMTGVPGAAAEYTFSKVETNVEIPEGFFRREVEK